MALMGSTMSHAQKRLLADHFARIILMLDGDETGRGATDELAERLVPLDFEVKTIRLGDGVQPDQLSSEAIHAELDGET